MRKVFTILLIASLPCASLGDDKLNDYFGVYHVDVGDGPKDFVSILSHEYVFEHGLVGVAIVGVLRTPMSAGGQLVSENFQPNPAFVKFLHAFIAENASKQDAIQESAKAQGSGFVYLIDGRTPAPQGEVPPEDIIGAFAVENGAIVNGSYHGNLEYHEILSSHGFFQLEAELMDELRDTLKESASQ